jgi:hypothetical protein
MRRLFAALALTVLLAGCASTANDDTDPGGVTPVGPQPTAVAPVAAGSIAEAQQSNGAVVPGYTVSVPKLGLTDVSLVALGLNPDHTIQVPPLAQPGELGVYAKGPMPGQVGPSVILGHINSGGTAGAFAHLADLRVGDEVTTTGPGLRTRFRVYRTQVIDKAEFPTHDVYSDAPGPELRLISCGGQLDQAAHNYLGQVIVYARKV